MRSSFFTALLSGFFCLLMTSSVSAQTGSSDVTDVTGIYQTMMGSKPVRAKDVGESTNPNNLMYMVFDENNEVFAISVKSMAEVSRKNLPKLVEKGLAYGGTYVFDGSTLEINYDGQNPLTMDYDAKQKAFVSQEPTNTVKFVFRKKY
ncbi:MAG: hypothetical protein ACKO5C_05030 [Ferruginibacter sp.]